MTQATILELIEWQWKGYAQYHTAKLNLILHIVFVPLFIWGNVGLIASVLRFQWMGAVASLLVMAFAFAMQGIGHKVEPTPALPFSSASNATKRILIEQWVTFPKFVISGAWWKALQK
jgi:uncharacterized membrane protein YGL010W